MANNKWKVNTWYVFNKRGEFVMGFRCKGRETSARKMLSEFIKCGDLNSAETYTIKLAPEGGMFA